MRHFFLAGFFKFKRKKVYKNGNAQFYCAVEGCKANMNAEYSSKENQNFEEPIPDLSSLTPPHGHVGSHHPMQVHYTTLHYTTLHYTTLQVGPRLVEAGRQRMQEAMVAQPLRPVAEVFEEVLTSYTALLSTDEREEFVQFFPTFKSTERSLYRCNANKL